MELIEIIVIVVFVLLVLGLVGWSITSCHNFFQLEAKPKKIPVRSVTSPTGLVKGQAARGGGGNLLGWKHVVREVNVNEASYTTC
jgi:hypothetical protein